jgi:hypothetical protein
MSHRQLAAGRCDRLRESRAATSYRELTRSRDQAHGFQPVPPALQDCVPVPVGSVQLMI